MSVKFNPKAAGLGAALVILAAVPAAYFYTQYRDTQQKLANPTEYAKEEAQLLITKVGKLIELPAGEEPTIATVSDAAKLSEQPFFAKAQNGDKVLIFTQARKAILYRPATNKIIEVAPVNIGNNEESASPTPEPTATPTPSKAATATPTQNP